VGRELADCVWVKEQSLLSGLLLLGHLRPERAVAALVSISPDCLFLLALSALGAVDGCDKRFLIINLV